MSPVERSAGTLRRGIEKTLARTADARFIEFAMPTPGVIPREVVRALEQDLVIVSKTTVGVESIHVKHDYYALWDRVLHGMGNTSFDVIAAPI